MSENRHSFGIQSKGARNYQEDAFNILESKSGILFVLCDGMGGHVAGNEASQLAIDGFVKGFSEHANANVAKRLEIASNTANQRLEEVIQQKPELNGMGTTLLAVYKEGNTIQWVSIGDSPLWLVRDGQLKRLNDDHSLASVFDALVKQGRMTREQAAADPNRNMLRSCLKGEEIDQIDVSEEPFLLVDGDCLLIASDGLDSLSNEEIVEICVKQNLSTAEQTCIHLMGAIEERSNSDQDNTTIICYRHHSEPKNLPQKNKPNGPPQNAIFQDYNSVSIGQATGRTTHSAWPYLGVIIIVLIIAAWFINEPYQPPKPTHPTPIVLESVSSNEKNDSAVQTSNDEVVTQPDTSSLTQLTVETSPAAEKPSTDSTQLSPTDKNDSAAEDAQEEGLKKSNTASPTQLSVEVSPESEKPSVDPIQSSTTQNIDAGPEAYEKSVVTEPDTSMSTPRAVKGLTQFLKVDEG